MSSQEKNYGKGQSNTRGETRPQAERGNRTCDLVLSASTQAIIGDKAAEMVDVWF